MTSGLTRTAVIVAGFVVVLIAALWIFQRRLIYFPDTTRAPAAAQIIPGAEDVILRTSDDLELGAWFVPARGDAREVAVLVANGNAGHRAGRAILADELARAGFDVLLFDYRGYGGNPGNPSEDGLARDARAAVSHLVDVRQLRTDRIVYFGESLGAAVVVEVASEHPPAGMLLRSPFTSLVDVGKAHYGVLPVGLLLRDEFPVLEVVSDLPVPMTVVYGDADTIVPPAQSREVAAAAAGPVEVVAVAGADHNDAAMISGDELIGAVIDLADRAIESTSDGP